MTFSVRWRVIAPGRTQQVRLLVAVPRSRPPHQEVLSLRYVGRRPDQTWERHGTAFAEYLLDAPRGEVTVGIEARVRVRRHDLSTMRPAASTEDATTLARYRGAERYLELDDPGVRQEAAAVPRVAGDPLGQVLALYHHVIHRLRYAGYNTDSPGAASTLRAGGGDCTDFADVLVALARVLGFPARHVTGYVRSVPGLIPHHSWAEVHVATHGWVPLDPLFGAQRKTTPFRRPPDYVHLYDHRNEAVGDFYQYWYEGDPVRLEYRFALDGVAYRSYGKALP
jgi:transglutaminase-like putative cysteine protease